jgi:cytochrome P450
MRPAIEDITTTLLDQLAAKPRGEVVDLRDEFARPLPGQAARNLLGVPEEFWPVVDRVLDTIAYTGIDQAKVQASPADFRNLGTVLVAHKRTQPGDDLLSALIAARDDDGSRLSEDELESTVLTLLRAGYITVLGLVTNAAAALLTHPEQLAKVRAGQVGWDDVVEETLRVANPVEHMPLRYAVADIEVSGVTIKKGDVILMSFGAIGRDPGVHGDTAGHFEVDRPDKRHLAFGHGVHYCVGAPLGRMEARIALPALFERFPDMSLAVAEDELEPAPTFILKGYRSLPVRLTS